MSIVDKLKKNLLSKLEENQLKTNEAHRSTYIELSKLTDEEREEKFIQFSEHCDELYNLLKTAYNHGIESIFCCAGHRPGDYGYVIFKVSNENLKTLQTIGKVLSHEGISTNFEYHYAFGKRVSYHSFKAQSWEWLELAADVIENPERYNDVEPEIYYHEEMGSKPNRVNQPFLEKVRDFLIEKLKKENNLEVLGDGTEEKESLERKSFSEKMQEEYPVETMPEVREANPPDGEKGQNKNDGDKQGHESK